MKEKNGLIIKLAEIITLIVIYYIVGIKNLFLYTISISLYNIFTSAFDHISITDALSKTNNKEKLFKYILLMIALITSMFILLGIVVSDIISIVLNLNDILIIFITMGLSIITRPYINLLIEYLIAKTKNNRLFKITTCYYFLENILLVIISIFTFKVFKLPINIAMCLLYLSKILSAIIISLLLYLITKDKKYPKESNEDINYKKEIKNILTNNYHQSLVKIVKSSFYYVSIVLLYMILSTRYNYKLDTVKEDITFIYLYGINIISILIYIATEMNKELPQELLPTNRVYNNFKIMLSVAIVLSIVDPLTSKILFNTPKYAVYLGMLNFMAIFSLLYDITYSYLKNKKIINISLIIGIIIKIITIIPLINAFYRTGYNLIYGDILSSVIGMIVSITINYIYIRNKESKKENYFNKLLDIFYDNIVLCIILIAIQFIIPLDTDNYFQSLGLLIIYLGISIVIVKLKNKKRG